LSLKDVLDRFALVSGLEQEEISKWIFVITDCIKYFESRLNINLLSDIQKSRLTHACAVYSYYKYTLMTFASKSAKFKAGDLEITQSENMLECAHSMWQQEKSEIVDIIDFDDFCFSRVRA